MNQTAFDVAIVCLVALGTLNLLPTTFILYWIVSGSMVWHVAIKRHGIRSSCVGAPRCTVYKCECGTEWEEWS